MYNIMDVDTIKKVVILVVDLFNLQVEIEEKVPI